MIFTELAVRSLSPGIYFDEKTPAFGLRVGKLKKTWLVVRGRTRSQVVLGHYPAMTLGEARVAARRAMLESATPKPMVITFAEARMRYLAEHKGRPSTKKELTRLLNRRFAELDARDLTSITDKDVQKQIGTLAPSESLHAFRAVRAMLKWCTRPPRRFIQHSPIEGYAPPGRDGRRTRILSDSEVARVLGASSGQSGAIIKLMLLWGTRRGETLALRWDWIIDGILTIPAEITKSARPHTIPILPLAQSILDGIPKMGDHLFAGERKPIVHINVATWNRMHGRLLKTSDTTGWSAHDARRTFRSACARHGVRREIAEILLNHTQGPLDEIYDHYDYLNEKTEALAKIEHWINSLTPSHSMAL